MKLRKHLFCSFEPDLEYFLYWSDSQKGVTSKIEKAYISGYISGMAGSFNQQFISMFKEELRSINIPGVLSVISLIIECTFFVLNLLAQCVSYVTLGVVSDSLSKFYACKFIVFFVYMSYGTI